MRHSALRALLIWGFVLPLTDKMSKSNEGLRLARLARAEQGWGPLTQNTALGTLLSAASVGFRSERRDAEARAGVSHEPPLSDAKRKQTADHVILDADKLRLPTEFLSECHFNRSEAGSRGGALTPSAKASGYLSRSRRPATPVWKEYKYALPPLIQTASKSSICPSAHKPCTNHSKTACFRWL
jgi:hypothetical protein